MNGPKNGLQPTPRRGSKNSTYAEYERAFTKYIYPKFGEDAFLAPLAKKRYRLYWRG